MTRTTHEIKQKEIQELEQLIRKLNDDLYLLKNKYTYDDLVTDVTNQINDYNHGKYCNFRYNLYKNDKFITIVLDTSVVNSTSIIILESLNEYLKDLDRNFTVRLETYDKDTLHNILNNIMSC